MNGLLVSEGFRLSGGTSEPNLGLPQLGSRTACLMSEFS